MGASKDRNGGDYPQERYGIGVYTPRLNHDELTKIDSKYTFLHTPVPDEVSEQGCSTRTLYVREYPWINDDDGPCSR